MVELVRGSQQEIMVGEGVVIRVLEIRGDQVRLLVKAPPGVEVRRQEVAQALEEDAERKKARKDCSGVHAPT